MKTKFKITPKHIQDICYLAWDAKTNNPFGYKIVKIGITEPGNIAERVRNCAYATRHYNLRFVFFGKNAKEVEKELKKILKPFLIPFEPEEDEIVWVDSNDETFLLPLEVLEAIKKEYGFKAMTMTNLNTDPEFAPLKDCHKEPDKCKYQYNMSLDSDFHNDFWESLQENIDDSKSKLFIKPDPQSLTIKKINFSARNLVSKKK